MERRSQTTRGEQMRYVDSSVLSEDQTLAHWMKEASESGIEEFRCQAGYFTLEGAAILLATIAKCARQNARISLLLGSNGGTTLASHVAYLAGKLDVPRENVSLGIVKFADSLFHPKVYAFSRTDGSKTCYVGSANMTGAGVSGKNVEAGIILDTVEGDDGEILDQISERIEFWFDNNLAGLTVVGGPDDIDRLLESKSLAQEPKARNRDPGEEGAVASEKSDLVAFRRKPLFTLPALPADARGKNEQSGPFSDLSAREFETLTARTEASFHYPQGTHLGHILSILFYFSGNRNGTPFDDEFIRLSGGFGQGRIATYRRQVKFKLLASMELGLISDIRLSDDISDYKVVLTERGKSLWNLIDPFLDTKILMLEREQSGMYSTKMRLEAREYNAIVAAALDKSDDLKTVYLDVMLDTPAVDQMLQLLRTHESGVPIPKKQIYEEFFRFLPVLDFCNAVGINPATDEGARHRCPFLLNILESCGLLGQSLTDVTLTG